MKLIEDIGMKFATETSKKKARFGIYECSICYIPFETQTESVRRGQNKCKGCASRKTNTTHGMTKHSLYGVWANEKNRCKDTSNCRYGGRGIVFSKEFSEFPIWLKYIESLEDAYTEHYSIDRIDNERGYERGNLRWASKSTQAQNTTNKAINNTTGYRGVYLSPNKKTFYSQVTINGKRRHIGVYETKEEAGRAYDDYVKEKNMEHTLNF